MSDVTLSKDADKTLCLIYKEYLFRRKNGISKDVALYFDGETLNSIFQNNSITYELLELKNNSLIDLYITDEVSLNYNAIIYMENRFKNGFNEVTDFIAKFIP